MKVLFLHRYGKTLGGWNHRLQRQADLMSKKCKLKLVGMTSLTQEKEIKSAISSFKPDVIYVNGYELAYEVLKIFDKVVFDMGSVKIRNAMLHTHGLTFDKMRLMEKDKLLEIAKWGINSTIYFKEKAVIDKAKALIIWEGEEAWLVKQLYGNEEKLHDISMLFYDLPVPIKWEDKKDRVISIAAKWGKEGKNIGFLNTIREQIEIIVIGRGGKETAGFVSHDKLMDLMNDSKVVFCPYSCGGIGVMNEALKLGCNVVVGSWHPYLDYINDELIFNVERKIVDRSVDVIKKALIKYYSLKKVLPSEEEQINNIIKVCQSVAG